MVMSQEDLQGEVVRLRHLRRLDKQISEDAEAEVRVLRAEEENCALALEGLLQRLRKETSSSEIAVRILDRCDVIVGQLLHRK